MLRISPFNISPGHLLCDIHRLASQQTTNALTASPYLSDMGDAKTLQRGSLHTDAAYSQRNHPYRWPPDRVAGLDQLTPGNDHSSRCITFVNAVSNADSFFY